MRHRGGAGDRQHHRRVGDEPGQRHLGGCGAAGLGDLGDGAAALRQLTRLEREPGDEGQAIGLTRLQLVLVPALDDVVTVLHRDDRHDALGLAQMLDVDVRQSHVGDLALAPEFGQRAHRLLERHAGIGAVELIEVDALQLQAAQTSLTRLAQVLGPAVGVPLVGPGPHEPTLGGDHQVVGVRVEGLGDQVLAHLGAVGVRRVDEVDAELDGSAQHGDRLVVGRRRAPNARAGKAHGAEAEAADTAVADVVGQFECEGAGSGVVEGLGQLRCGGGSHGRVLPSTAAYAPLSPA